MADVPSPIPSLSRARELKISELSTHFANDDLSLEELERRIEMVYKAGSVAELETLTADLKGALPAPAPRDSLRRTVGRGKSNVPATYEVANTRLLSLMSSTKKVGRWQVPQKLDVVAVMSDTRLDMTHAAMPSAGVVDFEVRVVMASLKLIVPPGMRVIVDTHSVMSNVRSRADELPASDAPATTNAPVLRLTGFAFMSDVSVVVRRREDAAYYDDDDDD